MGDGKRPAIRLVVLVAALLAGVGVVGWRAFRGEPAAAPTPPAAVDGVPQEPLPPDPRLTAATPFRNVKPDVAYVGDAACAGCHPAIDKSFHAHPMGRSAAWTREAAAVERYDAAAGNPFRSGPFELRVDREDGRVVHTVRAAPGELSVPADLAVGSGTRGRSYLAVEGGTVWQTPISWYASAGGRWDLSPGFDLAAQVKRPIIPACLDCHANRVDPVPQTLNRYREPLFPVQPSVGCEQCHGPGSLHVAERTAALPPVTPDPSIVNPKHLSPALRSAVCEQCHLQGAVRVPRAGREVRDYRPGLPFADFATVFVRHPGLADGRRSVGQFEQMEQSRCFLGSGRTLGCTSCHDPHAVPAADRKDPFYRDRCLTCHETRGCTAPPADRREKADRCIDCHMPKADSSNIVHASITDHGIRRRPAAPAAPRGIPPGTDPVVPFRTGDVAAAGPEADRAVGIALTEVLASTHPAAQAALARAAAERLERSVPRWPDDVRGRLALCTALGRSGRAGDRFAEAERLGRLFPASELALAELSAAAAAAGRFDAAEAAADDWAKAAPRSVEPWLARAILRARRADWDGVGRDAAAVLALDPLHPQALLFRAAARHRRGEAAEANADADAAAGLLGNPQGKAAALDWYRRLLAPR